MQDTLAFDFATARFEVALKKWCSDKPFSLLAVRLRETKHWERYLEAMFEAPTGTTRTTSYQVKFMSNCVLASDVSAAVEAAVAHIEPMVAEFAE